MATCGHCGKRVTGILDHMRAKHNERFYARGPDRRVVWGYEFLKSISPGLVIDYENRKTSP